MNPWVDIANKVLRGEFNDSDNSTAESIIIGLRSQKEEVCKKALHAIRKLHNKLPKE